MRRLERWRVEVAEIDKKGVEVEVDMDAASPKRKREAFHKERIAEKVADDEKRNRMVVRR